MDATIAGPAFIGIGSRRPARAAISPPRLKNCRWLKHCAIQLPNVFYSEPIDLRRTM